MNDILGILIGVNLALVAWLIGLIAQAKLRLNAVRQLAAAMDDVDEDQPAVAGLMVNSPFGPVPMVMDDETETLFKELQEHTSWFAKRNMRKAINDLEMDRLKLLERER